ncbi:branched-chain amino acid ABC transporter permease [Acidihalobacter ferrooxydans]|uniref:Branched-chain amino acid ABC transporter permease n=1 Tax=Acidihalobacter ferrooxydans TaxID=1765967 RepID=A0A1P8UG92_9GAMM|nr:branched-chain amino acid ABC transporter permease [Acidihalobacter ferrooxydans]APZ42862.1 branched-chain amino acid ABC transporter permease [Acidihalobacter ferrooxydans]
MELLLFNVLNGLLLGVFYALMAMGLSLILGLNRIINFAHGGFLALAGYIAYSLLPYLGFFGVLIVAPLLTAVLGVLVERLLIKRLYGRDPLFSLLLTFGLVLIMEDMIRTIWGAQGLPLQIPAVLQSALSQTYFFITGYRVLILGIAVALTIGLLLFLRFTKIGLRILAGASDLDTISALGVNIHLLRAVSFAAGIFLAGVAGVLAAGWQGLSPQMGDSLIMPSFVAIIVGGVGSLLGSLLGGLLIGVASGVTSAFYPQASQLVIYLIMALVLAIRPRGLLGKKGVFE